MIAICGVLSVIWDVYPCRPGHGVDICHIARTGGAFLNLGVIWKSDWFTSVVMTVLFLVACQYAFQPLQRIEDLMYDYQMAHLEGTSDGHIILINLDQKDLSAPGQQMMATVIGKLSEAGAHVIALDMLYDQAEAAAGAGQTDRAGLVKIVRRSGNTVLPIFLDVSTSHEYSNDMLPHELHGLSIIHVNPSPVAAKPIKGSNLRYPYAALIQVSAGVGHMSVFGDADGSVRSEPLVISYADKYFPSMPLVLAAKVLQIPLDDIRINLGVDIELGAMNLVTDAKERLYPKFFRDMQDDSFKSYTFRNVLSGRVAADVLKGKIVLIGSAASRLATPVGSMSRIEFTAHVLQSILQDQYISRPFWTHRFEMGLLLFIGLYLIFLLPRFTQRVAMLASGLLALVLIAGGWVTLSSYALWIQVFSAALLLITGHALLLIKHALGSSSKRLQRQSVASLDETNRMLGLSFQSQGMLDKALEKFMVCRFDEQMAQLFYDLAHTFERKRHFKQAVAAYTHIIGHDPAYRDVPMRIIQAENAMEAQNNKDSNSALSSLLVHGDSRPVLGRYEIISELGKGAMGTVYLGKDPKINRQVAIKTMALSQEFEPDELEEVKAKFFHEAEIAGMLNHPNIVTIFDAGDEYDLAYIAMEFLDGIDLVAYTKKGRLLPVTTTLKIVAKVAEALKYAHAHGVIHRDIKPANIMILKNKSVKVTDFGIAHIAESSKKKAATVLGTPSYMSPEQLSGKQLDGRSDLFSLGVMLYELVSGVRPFRGESITKLMFKIAKEPHVDVRQHNADVPDCISLLVDSMLTKKANLRIESAAAVLDKIAACLKELKQLEGGQ